MTYHHRTVATTTRGLLELATSVYWKPVWHILNGQFTLVLANAMHIRHVPGARAI